MNRGFTYIELIIIITVAAVVLTPILASFVETNRSAADGYKTQLALFLAQDLMEEIRTRKFDEDTPAGGGVVAPGSNNIGLEAGENAAGPRNAYDDVDDYHGYTEGTLKDMNGVTLAEATGYTRTVTVEYVDAATPDTVSVTPPTDYKRVTVLISWQAGTRDVRLRMVVANF